MTDKPVKDTPSRRGAACLRVTQVLGRIGDKWTVMVIILLRERGYRFNELKRGIDSISQRMLTLTLRNMERDGLVTRTVTPSIPPRVDYELTKIGLSLAGPVKLLGEWAFENLPGIAAAQERYDRKEGPGGRRPARAGGVSISAVAPELGQAPESALGAASKHVTGTSPRRYLQEIPMGRGPKRRAI